MNLLNICEGIERSHLGTAVRTSNWLFPAIETVHIVGLILVIGSIMWLDFRLLGFSENTSVSQVAHRVMPGAWTGFVVSVSTGVLLFCSEAAHMYINPAFRIKMLLLLLIGVNAGAFQIFTWRNSQAWDIEIAPPIAARLAGVLSILLWCGVVAAGRWIAYSGSE